MVAAAIVNEIPVLKCHSLVPSVAESFYPRTLS